MNWNILKDGLCPKDGCGKKLNMGLLDELYTCSACNFNIRKEKFEKISYGARIGQYMRKTESEDNLSGLNNLGHDVVTEDFSDSPYKDK